uniref:Uncharacterized protein n=1 Tax=Caenorhabditis japonica TaxID=281687 RepID=A0A8R1E7P3_CAEJA
MVRIRNGMNQERPIQKWYESEAIQNPYHFGFVPLLTRAFLIWALHIRTTSNSGGFGFGRSADSYHFGFGRFGFGAAPV